MTLSIITQPRVIRDFCTYDLEWIPGDLTVRMAGFFDGEQYRCHRSVDDFIDNEFTSRNRGKWFYAHAGGMADIQFVLEKIIDRIHAGDRSWDVDAKFSGASAIIAKVRRAKNVFILVDSYWLLRDKLKNIGEWIGFPKADSFADGEDPDEEGISDEEYERRSRNRREWYRTVDFATLRSYNEGDCVLLWKAIKEFQGALLDMGGQLQMTAASCAMHLFRRKYLKENIDTNDTVNACAMEAYTASRVEKYVDEVENSYYYDINSSFPYAMTFPAPGKFAGTSYSLPTREDALYLADVEVEVQDCEVPPLPYRMAGRIFFPVGRWRSWMCNVDLELLLAEGGKLHKVHEVMRFEPFYALKGYAEDIYKRRKNATSDFEKVALKLVLNSLYGKFAEGQDKESLLINPSAELMNSIFRKGNKNEASIEEWFPGAWIKREKMDIPHRHVPIATHITAIARRTIYGFMASCRDRHYCDTDGFSTTERMGTSKELGALKLEKMIRYGHFAGSKNYMLDADILGDDGIWKPKRIVKGKGMSRLTASRYMALMEGDAITMERMTRIKELYSQERHKPEERTIEKRMRLHSLWTPGFDPTQHVVPKRMMYPDGTSRPWHLDELRTLLPQE